MKSPMTRVKEKELGKIYQLLYYFKNTNTSHVFDVWRRGGIPNMQLTAWCICVCSEETIFINSNN